MNIKSLFETKIKCVNNKLVLIGYTVKKPTDRYYDWELPAPEDDITQYQNYKVQFRIKDEYENEVLRLSGTIPFEGNDILTTEGIEIPSSLFERMDLVLIRSKDDLLGSYQVVLKPESIKSTITNCPTCGSEVTVGGEGITHYYIPKNKNVDLIKLRSKFFDECTDKNTDVDRYHGNLYPKVNMTPHDLFEWIKKNII